MSEKKNTKIDLRSVLVETVIAIALFMLLSFFTTLLISSETIKLQYIKTVNVIILLLSSIFATVIKKTTNIITSLMSAIMIILIIIFAAACQKGSGGDANSIVFSCIIVIAGKVIPNVINRERYKSKKRKSRKRAK